MNKEFADSLELSELHNEDVSLPNEGEQDAEDYPRLEESKPEGARIKIFLDFDNSFIVMYPVIYLNGEEYKIDFRRSGQGRSAVDDFVFSLVSYLYRFGFVRSKYFPALLTMPAVYADDVLKFMLEAVPQLLQVAALYYTENFKRVMIRNTIRFGVSSNQTSIEEYLECGFTYDSGISPEELAEMLRALDDKEKLRFFQLRGGGFVDLSAAKVQETLQFLRKFGVSEDDLERRKIKIPRCEVPYSAALFKEAEASQAVEFSGFNIKGLEQRVFALRNREQKLPQGLRCELRPYQREGFRWLKELSGAGLGGILADDMGLGKTVQAISLLLSENEEKGSLKALVVAPTSLVDNWLSELNKFAPSLNCTALVGSAEARQEIFAAWDDYDVFVTSYGVAVNDIERYKNKALDILILDEAQKIKNHLAKTTRVIKRIKAAGKFALTGTPMENNLAELWSIFNWLMPPLLKEFRDFKRKYLNQGADLEELRRKIKPFILRRVKQEVLADLPEKTETTIKIELTERQKELYLAYREKALQLLSEEQILNVFATLTRLRQICCHPGMFVDSYTEPTGKLEALLDMIGELRLEGRRALVFSQFTSMLDIIEAELSEQGVAYCRLDGQTPQKQRSRIITDFEQGGPTVFLISLKAGGTGLNLTAADTVIHVDPWWNPSVEEQASARVYRIGQTKGVQIIYLIAKGTIEEKINQVKRQKAELIEQLIRPGEQMLTSLSVEELRELL